MASCPFGFESTAAEVAAAAADQLRGKLVVATGGTSGIGLEACSALAGAGARIVMGARKSAKGEAAVSRIRAEGATGEVEWLPLDLCSLDSVRAFAAELLQRGEPVSILLNNAGVFNETLRRSAEGFEATFATAVVGHFLLTQLLMPLLLAAPGGARVVATSSVAHKQLQPNGCGLWWDDLHFNEREYNGFMAYTQSKHAVILFVRELSRRFADQGVIGVAVHPGVIMTKLVTSLDPDFVKRAGLMKEDGSPCDGAKTPQQGAATAVAAATLPGIEPGAYMEDCRVTGANDNTLHDDPMQQEGVLRTALDPEAAERLWGMVEEMVSSSAPDVPEAVGYN